eukprot:NODE_1350_length_632_cov_829.775300_g951_i0.p1 GENE.NODE_1350_length_632_cov_829.775300_g951_i0~~NODE_1350_length_632_cov_829.775300_g951_i0.p1  ORF type:complete len:169 (-),score=79.61 NODE_1350_length_632_cov_829.775300_g951_i0:124-600(-)
MGAKAKREAEEKAKAEEEAALKARGMRKVTRTVTNVDEAMLEVFAWFDKPVGGQGAGQGVLTRQQLSNALHGLGQLPNRSVDEYTRVMGTRVHYKSLATTSTSVTEEEPIPAPKEQPKEEATESKAEEAKESEAPADKEATDESGKATDGGAEKMDED